MLVLNLTVNDLEIKLGMALSSSKLKDHKFKRPGLLSGLKEHPGQKVYWSKNCEIRCFGGEFELIPVLDVKAGADLMYGTSAYLIFVNKILYMVTFQLVGNEMMADWFEEKFEKPAVISFGQPTSKDFNTTIWDNTESKVMIENITHSQHVHFHWTLNI